MTVQDAISRYPWLHEILHELPDDALSQIIVRNYRPNETLIADCYNNPYTFIILKGVCCTYQISEAGNQFVLRKATCGDVVGLSIYPGSCEFDSVIRTKTDLCAVLLPKALVQLWFGKYPAFSSIVSQRVIARLHDLVNLLSVCNNSPSYLAIMAYMEYNYRFYARSSPESYTGPIEILESRQNIADFLGVDTRSVYRLLKKLTEEGLISVSNRRLYIDKQQCEHLHQVRYCESL